jgi:hypothetical protein
MKVFQILQETSYTVPKYLRKPPIQCPNTSGNLLYSAQILQETSYTVPKYLRKPPIQCPNTSGNLSYSAQILQETSYTGFPEVFEHCIGGFLKYLGNV